MKPFEQAQGETFDRTDDLIDVRDVITRFEQLDDKEQSKARAKALKSTDGIDAKLAEEEEEERLQLRDLIEELRGNGGDEQYQGDWFPITLINEDHFEDYARELAEDIGAIPDDMSWPCNCIDWEQAANELRGDYSEVEIDGTTFYYR